MIKRNRLGLLVALFAASAVAHADSSGCQKYYEKAVNNDEWATGVQISVMSTGWFVPVGLISTTDGMVKKIKYKPVLDLIDQAHLGNGIDLVLFTGDLKKRPGLEQITLDHVAQTIARADEQQYLCPGGGPNRVDDDRDLLGKGEFSDLIASMVK